jgi:dihydroneopterin triphosphate diphosphatase
LPAITSRFVDCHVFRLVSDGHGSLRDEWLLMKRAPQIMLGGTWQMVSGHIEPGEKAYECAFRELREETGLPVVHFYQASYVNRFYLAALDEIVLSPVFCAEVDPKAEVVLSEEHTEYAWLSPEEAYRRLPWPGQRKALATVREQFVLGPPFPQSCIDRLCGIGVHTA